MEIKKAFQEMYKEYNKFNNTALKGNFKEKSKNAILTVGAYKLDIEEDVNKELENIKNKFMCSEQFRDFIRKTGAVYEETDNIYWQAHGVTIMSKQIRFRF